jgi:putative PEP-CTERM system histidine kinase
MAIAAFDAAIFSIAAAAYIILLVLILLSRQRSGARTFVVIASAMTAVSAAVVATGWSGPTGLIGAILEFAGSGGWSIFVLYLVQRRIASDLWPSMWLYGCVILIGILMLGFPLIHALVDSNSETSLPLLGELGSRLALSVFGILLTENLYRNTAPEFRWQINLLCVGLGALFCYGLIIYADALLFHRVSLLLWHGRAIVMIVAAPLIGVAVARNRDWQIDIHVSRVVVFHTATLVGSGIFLLALAVTGEVLRAVQPGWGDLAEVTLVVAGAAAIGVVLTSGSTRSYLKRVLVDNFFSHRYDYRQEWLKSIQLLSADPRHAAVQSRVINVIAEIADSPAGLLWVRDLDGTAFLWAGSWNHPAVTAVEPADSAFVGLFKGANWVIEVDEAADGPSWLGKINKAWLVVPLPHQNQLIGFVVLTRPRAPLKLDRETFDLLRIVGRQAATHIIEQRYAQTIAETRELHAYGKRFAFAIHDMKNVAGQLTMLLQNARKHGDNPEFQEDVLITVRSAVDRMNGILQRLRSNQPWAGEEFIAPSEIIAEEVTALRRSHQTKINVTDCSGTAAVAMDEGAFRSVIRHLCENAIDASPAHVELHLSRDATRLQVEIIDRGVGMSPEFIRDKLFQPFGSTKGDGLGIGAYQARELVRAIGGDLIVTSQPGMGTTMSVLLPCLSPTPNSGLDTPLKKASG